MASLTPLSYSVPKPTPHQLEEALVRLEAIRDVSVAGWHDLEARDNWMVLRGEYSNESPMEVNPLLWRRARNLIKVDEIIDFTRILTSKQFLDFVNTARARSEGATPTVADDEHPVAPPPTSDQKTASPSTAFAALLAGSGFSETASAEFFHLIGANPKTPRQWSSVFTSMAQLLSAIAGGVANSAEPFNPTYGLVDRDYVTLFHQRPVSYLVGTLAANKAEARELSSDGLIYFLLGTRKGVMSEDHKTITYDGLDLKLGDHYEILDRDMAVRVVAKISRESGYGYLFHAVSKEAIQIASLFLTVYGAEKTGNRLVVKPLAEGSARTGLWKFFDHPKIREIQTLEANLADPMQKLAARIATHGAVHNLVTAPGLAHISYLRVIVQDFLDQNTLPLVGVWRNVISALEKVYLEDVKAWEDRLARFDEQFPDNGGARIFSLCKALAIKAPQNTTFELMRKVRTLAPRKAKLEKAGQQATIFMKKPDLLELVRHSDGQGGTLAFNYSSNKMGRPIPIGHIDPGTVRAILDDSRAKIRNAEVDKVKDGKRSGNAPQYQSLLVDEHVPGTVMVNAMNVSREWMDQLHEIKAYHPQMAAELDPLRETKIMVWEVNEDFHFGNALSKVFEWTTGDIANRVGVDGASDNCPPTSVRICSPGVLKTGEFEKQFVFFNRHVDIRNAPGGQGIDPAHPQSSLLDKLIAANPSAISFRATMSSEWNDTDEEGVTMPHPLRKIVRHFRNVTFIPGERCHNGIFFVVASNRRDVPLERFEDDSAVRRTQLEWDGFSVRYCLHMYRANALKNLATVLGITAPFIPSPSALNNFDHYRRPSDYVSRKPDWANWGITAIQTAQVTEMLDVDRSHITVIDDNGDDDDDLQAMMIDFVMAGSGTSTPAPVRHEAAIGGLDGTED